MEISGNTPESWYQKMCHLVGNSSSIDISILSSMLIFSIEKEINSCIVIGLTLLW